MIEAAELKQKNVLITGASGLVGKALCKNLGLSGYTVFKLERNSRAAPFHYIEAENRVVLDATIPLYAVINLAGPNLSDRRWTRVRKNYILNSRVKLTNALSKALANSSTTPKIYLSASAIGFYGLTGSNSADESSPPGDDFLANVCKQWEAATSSAEQAGINTVHLRLGVILSRHGGMLQKLLLPFKLGLGGKVGNGCQYLSWISIFDVIDVILYLLEKRPHITALNVVADQNVTNHQFSKELGKALRKPCMIPLPSIIVKLIFGEMGDALLLGSTRVKSSKLKDLGISLRYPVLASALRKVLDEN
jgi:uncharacterized protein